MMVVGRAFGCRACAAAIGSLSGDFARAGWTVSSGPMPRAEAVARSRPDALSQLAVSRVAFLHAEGYRIARSVCPRAEFNAYRERLPRSVRRDVEVVPPGHVGLIVQAITGADSPLLALYGHVRADRDPADALAGLERRLRWHLR